MAVLKLVGVALVLLAAGAASAADRIFDLDGAVVVKDPGFPAEKIPVTGLLSLFEDRTFTLNLDGEITSGVWIQEKKKIQLFPEIPTASEYIQELEQGLSDLLRMSVELTSLKGPEAIKERDSGDVIMRSKTTFTLRPGPTANKPWKFKQSFKMEGVLR